MDWDTLKYWLSGALAVGLGWAGGAVEFVLHVLKVPHWH